jgi:hypothetical protein
MTHYCLPKNIIAWVAIAFLPFCSRGVAQEFVIEEEPTETVQEAIGFGKALVEDFDVGLDRYASVVVAKFQSAPDSTRFFESQARFERYQSDSFVWMKNVWKAKNIVDDRPKDRLNVIIPAYKNCEVELVRLGEHRFEMDIRDIIKVPGQEKPILVKESRFGTSCDSGVAPQDWPFVYETCFSTHSIQLACQDRTSNEFANWMRCLSAKSNGKGLDTIWAGIDARPGEVNGLSRIVFENELPVLFEICFVKEGYSTRPGKINLSKASRIAKVETRWKKLDLISVPENVRAVFYVSGAQDGFEELYVEAKLEFFLPGTKEFEKVEEGARKMEERAKKLIESGRDAEEW